jgi:hypothetical protein
MKQYDEITQTISKAKGFEAGEEEEIFEFFPDEE